MSRPGSIVALPYARGNRRGCGILARVTTRAYRGYDVPGYIGALRREGELLAAAADRAGMGAGVPSCPDWAVRDLLKHTGYVHRWAAEFITRGLTRPEGGTSEAAILSQGPGDDRLPGWFREGHAALVQALGTAAPELNCWAFLGAPSPLAFWARRQAHETAIHRADYLMTLACGACGAPSGPGHAWRPVTPIRRSAWRPRLSGMPSGRPPRAARPARRDRSAPVPPCPATSAGSPAPRR